MRTIILWLATFTSIAGWTFGFNDYKIFYPLLALFILLLAIRISGEENINWIDEAGKKFFMWIAAANAIDWYGSYVLPNWFDPFAREWQEYGASLAAMIIIWIVENANNRKHRRQFEGENR